MNEREDVTEAYVNKTCTQITNPRDLYYGRVKKSFMRGVFIFGII